MKYTCLLRYHCHPPHPPRMMMIVTIKKLPLLCGPHSISSAVKNFLVRVHVHVRDGWVNHEPWRVHKVGLECILGGRWWVVRKRKRPGMGWGCGGDVDVDVDDEEASRWRNWRLKFSPVRIS